MLLEIFLIVLYIIVAVALDKIYLIYVRHRWFYNGAEYEIHRQKNINYRIGREIYDKKGEYKGAVSYMLSLARGPVSDGCHEFRFDEKTGYIIGQNGAIIYLFDQRGKRLTGASSEFVVGNDGIIYSHYRGEVIAVIDLNGRQLCEPYEPYVVQSKEWWFDWEKTQRKCAGESVKDRTY